MDDQIESEITKSTNFVLRASSSKSLDNDGLAAKKAKAMNHLQLAGLFFNEMSKKHNEESVVAAIKPELVKYRKLVDDHSKEGINNYAASVPRFEIDFDLSKTKTCLLDAKKFLQDHRKRPCRGDYEPCKFSEPTTADLIMLQTSFQQAYDSEEIEILENIPEQNSREGLILKASEKVDVADNEDKYSLIQPIFNKKPSQSTNSGSFSMFGQNEKTSTFPEKKQEAIKNTQTKNNAINAFPIFNKPKTASQSSSREGVVRKDSSEKMVFSDEMFMQLDNDVETSTKTPTSIFHKTQNPQKWDKHVFSAPKDPNPIEHAKYKQKVVPDLDEIIFGKKKTAQVDKTDNEREYSKKNRQNQENFDEQTNKDVQRRCDFKTASSELKIQNQKKYGNSDQIRPMVESDNSKAGKKSLGLRGNIHNKFVPPYKKDDSEEDKNKIDPETLTDERLKNIDPKMVELIMNEIMESGSSVNWDDIAGLDYAKGVIKEAIILPILRPDIFKGLRGPAKGLLLFGPPGTGKTMIGKCIAAQSKSTFFNISASAMTSKWIGEGEKMVRALFAVASVHQPSVIFIDEIDSLLSQRSETEHESSRRLKTEFLVHLDGAGTGDDDKILIVGATNRPHELDEAARRRLEKRLYIPLPEFEARYQIMRNLLQKECCHLKENEIMEIAKLADGFSGADMKGLCKEAAMYPIRDLSILEISEIDAHKVRPICFEDFKSALQSVRASVSQDDLGLYVKWDQTFGSSVKTIKPL